MKIRIALRLLASAGLIFACTDNPSSPRVSPQGGLRAQRVQGQRGWPRTIDDEFADIASAESSFGGFFLDSTHSAVVYLTDTSRLAAVRAAGLDAALSVRRILAANVRVVHAAYGFGALKRWYDCAAPQILGLQDAVLTDIDEAHNRLHFGVATPSAQGNAQTVVTACQIPSEAVTVDVVSRVVPSGALNETVFDSVRPLRGGIDIWFGGPARCTLGVIGQAGDGPFFISNSHCSHQRGTVDTASYWQMEIGNAADSIGRETLDPAYFSHPTLGCPSGRTCRMSDANMSHLHSSAAFVKGLVARTQSPSHNPAYGGSTALDPTNPGLFITAVDTSSGPAVGDSVCKTGATSGTTCGAISESCAAISFTEGGVNYTLICQYEVHAYLHAGDSGSPVYHWTSSADSTITFAGLAWGSLDSAGTHYLFYSQWDWIEWELFGADTVTVVADTPYVVHNKLGGRVSGPGSISVPDTNEWDAYAFAGTGSYSYQWKYENAGSSTWNSLGTSASQKRYVDGSTSDFTMRAIMMSGSDTVVRDTSVVVNIITGVDLSGTTWTHPGATCHWTATPTGGTAPYIYSWHGGSVVDTTSDPDTYSQYLISEGEYSIDVTVTDANGGEVSNSQDVYVEDGAPGC